jgi:glutamine amidotransferase
MKIAVGIVDYESGNIRSVVNAVETAGATTVLVRSPADLAQCSHVILPGVGAFGFCADRLRASGMVPSLEQWAVIDHKPLLGICVGMQLMADYSEEQGRHEGLGWIGGVVEKLEQTGDARIRIPHVGWNEAVFAERFGEFAVGDRADFYFDHSYAYHPPDITRELAACTHGRRFSAAVRRDNIVAVQFHPEKSQTAGMRLLKSFLEM